MKYKLLKPLPDIEVGTIIEYKDDKYFFENGSEVHAEFNDIFYRIFHRDSKDWYEVVKEPNTIFNLAGGKKFYLLDGHCNIIERENIYGMQKKDILNCFLTEREAKRNKLLRELATRTDKWLPDEGQIYTTFDNEGDLMRIIFYKECNMITYHLGAIFRDQEEYEKYITEEAKDLLFNI